MKTNPSQQLGTLLRVMEEHVDADTVTIEGGKFSNLYALLSQIRKDVLELENHELLKPRPCKEPPWGWGTSNVVQLFPAPAELVRVPVGADPFGDALNGRRFDDAVIDEVGA